MASSISQSQELSVLPTASDLLKLGSRGPAQVIEHPPWNAARDTVISLVTGSPSLIAVLGSPGSGKTTLLRNLDSKLSARGYAVRLLEFADDALAVDPAEVVLVDEADRISPTQVEALCQRGDATVILAALPAFAKHLQEHYPGVAIVPLTTLSPDEAFAFVAERLAQLGLPVVCLTEAAWAQLIKHGNGVPRLLLAFLNLTLLIAAEEHAEHATDVHVELATEVRNGVGGGADVEITSTSAACGEADAMAPVPESGMSANAGANAGKRTRRRWRGTVSAAVCLVAVAVLLIWWQTNQIASSGPNSWPVSVWVKREQIADAAMSAVVRAWTTAQHAVGAAAALVSATLQPSSPAGTNESRIASRTLIAPALSSMATAGTREPPGAPAATTSSNATMSSNEGKAALRAPVAPAQSSMATTGAGEQALAPAAATPSHAAPMDAKVSDQPAKPAPRTTQDLPAGALIRIVLTYPRGDMAAAKRGAELAQALRTDGLRADDPFPVAPRASNKGISYYFTQDAGAATDLGQRLHNEYGEAQLVRLPRAAGQPRPGTIEIALGSD